MNEWEWQLLEDKPALEQITVDGVSFTIGDRVRLPSNGPFWMFVPVRAKTAIWRGNFIYLSRMQPLRRQLEWHFLSGIS